jgi:hypothetical protein
MLLIVSSITIVGKLFFIAPMRVGGLVMLSNVVYEALFKRFAWKRWPIDAVTLIVVTPSWVLAVDWWAGLLFIIIYALTWGYALKRDLKMRTGNPGIQDQKYGRGEIDRRTGGWVPVPNPKVIVYIKGAIWNRTKLYDLGDWPVGHSADFEIIVLNPTILRSTFLMVVELASNDEKIELSKDFEKQNSAPLPGEFWKGKFSIRAKDVSEKPVNLRLSIKVGSYEVDETLSIRSVFAPEAVSIQKAVINRWKGGAKAGFAWRGDMDMYDPTTFQSVEGLRHTLEICRRYRIASSMYLSGRLSLVKSEHKKFCDYLGVDRDTSGIDEFIRFMREEVSMKAAIDFPYNTEKSFAIEVGNHMYLHYGTHASMDENNDWKNIAWIGDGRYPWQSEETGSFAEQRDNAVHNTNVIQDALGIKVRSWGVPGRVQDDFTAKALEAAGIEVGSDTNASMWTNVMRLPPPHHPKGCKHLVELTKKYPGDPNNAYKVAMLKYWMGLALRKRGTFIYMAHQHLLRYEGMAGSAATEEILRHVLAYYRGDFYVSTVFGLGQYWDRILCPKHRWVSIAVHDSAVLEVTNKGNDILEDIPIEITFSDGRQLLMLVSLPANKKITIKDFIIQNT